MAVPFENDINVTGNQSMLPHLVIKVLVSDDLQWPQGQAQGGMNGHNGSKDTGSTNARAAVEDRGCFGAGLHTIE